ncbi:MAG: quinolinate synthase NadA [Acidobacteriota bacterium]|nr:quinolinate synthase NadA [Acidobacteriota bacterium]
MKLLDEIQRLKIERNAVILAHNYQIPAIQDVADFIGDSLGLSLQAQATDAETIVFCGVHFMAETAAVLCPDKTVLIPDLEAGCSLASTITASQLRTWKEEHPGAAVVVYVNCSADVKAEADYCCTSANALRIVESIPADREILFAPDMFLGEYIREHTERTIHVWMGECHVHAAIRPADVEKQLAEHPDAELLIHPECGCVSNVMWQLSKGDLPADRTRITSTTGMIESIESSPASEFLVATETGILHQMKKRHPKRTFLPVKADAECMYMKMITLEKLAKALREGIHEVRVPKETASRARLAIERMVSIH